MKSLANPLWWLKVAPFYILHLACLMVFFVPFSWQWIWLGVGFYFLRMFGITAGFHRYFSHRSFKTSRVMQFIFALLGSLSVQQGALWWAAHHRRHHQFSATINDIHAPEQKGFYWAHMGWTLSLRYDHSDLSNIKDFTKYPELVFLDKVYSIPAILLGAVIWYFLGASAFVWGYLVSLIFNYHGTFFINSLCHIIGSRRFKTSDDSRNNFFLAFITMGEGWHNNHHFHQRSIRQGMYWWEIDMSYWVLKIMSALGLIWDLKVYPKKAYEAAAHQKQHPQDVSYDLTLAA